MSVQSCRLTVIRDEICPMHCNPASVKLEHPCMQANFHFVSTVAAATAATAASQLLLYSWG